MCHMSHRGRGGGGLSEKCQKIGSSYLNGLLWHFLLVVDVADAVDVVDVVDVVNVVDAVDA